MIKTHNILFKCLMLLVLAVGWGSDLYGVRFEPTFEANLNSETDSWYYIHFVNRNANGYMYAQADGARFKHGGNSVQDPAYFWQLIGDKDSGFKLISMSGEYAYWNNDFLSGTPDASQAAVFHLLNGTDADSWAIERHAASGTRNCLNPQGSNEIKTWSNDNGCRIQFKIATTENLEAAKSVAFPDMGTLGNHVNLVFQDNLGNPLADQTVVYTPVAGAPVNLTSSMDFYDFGGVDYSKSLFSLAVNYQSLKVSFDNDAQRLTFTITKLPNVLRYSSAPTTSGWDADTHWYTIQNNRNNQSGHNYKYLSTAESSVNENYTLKASIAALENNVGEAWAFVGSDEGIQIYNAAYGPDFVLGSSSSGDNASANFKMVLKDNPEGYITTFTAVPNSVLNAPSTNSYAFRVGKTGNVHIHITYGGLRTWNHDDAIVGSNNDGGSSFTITAIEEVDFNALTPCDVYKAQWSGASTTDFDITYNHSGSTFGRRGVVSDGAFFIVNHDSPVALSDFTTTVSEDYALASVNIQDDPAHAYRILDFFIKDAKATEEWTVKVNDGYLVNYAGLDYANDDIFYLRPEVAPLRTDLTINAPDNKFVWGPIVDTKAKTVTYEVRDLATEIPTGWYQLQFNANASTIATINGKIKNEEGNINTKANTIYLAPAIYEPGNNRYFKFTGVPEYAGEASTFVYIRNNTNGNLTFVNSRTGAEYTAPGFTFADGHLTKTSNWSYESTSHPLEGPFLLNQGSHTLTFNVAPANLADYKVYRVTITGSGASNDVRLNINNANILGNKTVANQGFLFMSKDAVVPIVRSQVSVQSGIATVDGLSIGEEVNGVTPITINLTTKQSLWHISITGDAKRAEDRVTYNGIDYDDESVIGIPVGTTPSAVDFTTNVTDRFVWGPSINEKLHTVTFEVRTAATDLTQGKWYQLQLSPTASGRYYVPNATGNLVEGVLKMNPRNAGSQIYMIGGNKKSGDWTVELIGKPENETETYLYVNSRSGNATQVMMQNGYYITGESKLSASPATTQFEYNSTTHEFHWRNPVYPWGNLNGMTAAVGKSSSADGPIKVIAHEVPVKAYKVSFTNGIGTLIYNGDVKILGSKRAENGYFIFANEGAFLEGEDIDNIDISKFDIRGLDGTINSITASTSNGITTLTVDVNTPTYDHEIIHRQAHYYDWLETDANKPQHGFIKEGEGWLSRQASDGITVIREQNTAHFEIPIYLKQGDANAFQSYLPTNQLGSYQRWYDYDTDGMVDGNVLISPARDESNASYRFNNGHVTFNQNIKPTFKLPVGVESYNVGLDLSRLTDYNYYNSGSLSGCMLEPTLGMRIIYQVRDAKLMAKDLKTKTAAGKFLEVHDIAFPNVKHGKYEDKTLSNLLPLNLDLNNYWIFDGSGETDADLLQLTENGNVQMVVELAGGNAPLQHVMKIPRTISRESGNISYSSFNTGHFILFQYPDGGVVEPGSTATINVYLKKNGSAERYNLAQFNLSFIGNAEPVPVTELGGSHRHPDALSEAFGAPVAELTFDNTKNEEWTNHYKYPLDYKGVSYAFGAMNNRSWFASRGEYSLRVEGETTGGIVNKYYPVQNYFNSMKDVAASMGTSKVADNYFLYIDAADQPGKVASIELEDALCAGSRLYCYGYIGCTSGGTQYYGNTNQNPTSILINVMGIDKTTGKEVLVYSYCPGIISSRGYDKDGRTVFSSALGRGTSYENHSGDTNYWALWQQVGFSFAISAEVASQMRAYSVQIVNNAYNSEGADTVLDDFEIYVKKPGAEVQNTTPLCSDQIRHIKIITEYETLLEATGEDTNHDGLMNVGFCFLDKEVYDKVLEDNADQDADHGFLRTDPENKYNKAFGEALMGVRTLDRTNKDHAFHNFNIIRDGEISNIYGETKQHFYTDIPQYSFKESGDDVVYRDIIRGERYIVFKESVAHGEASGISNHKWTAGKSYYLLFTTDAIPESNIADHDLGCTVFNLDDNRCAVLYEFTVAPPVTIKGDVEEIVSGDEVRACAGQTSTLTVNLNGRTETKDVVIKNLNYDWWLGYVSDSHMLMENGVPQVDAYGHAIFDGPQHTAAYNTIPATLQNYMNVWWGKYTAPHTHLDKNVGDRIYLSDALLEFRRAYPEATDLIGVEPKHVVGDTEEYDLTQEMIDCIAHFLEIEPESGITPLVLGKKEMNLSLGIEKADKDKVVHFVVIPIAPNLYSIDEDAIYCPDPQELKVQLLNEAPTLANGFNNMVYPESMDNVPLRVGLQQINAVRQRTSGPQRTLSVPLRKAAFAYAEGEYLMKTAEAEIHLVGSDDPAYKLQENVTQDFQDNGLIEDTDIESMFINAGNVEVLSVKRGAANPTMQITFNHNVTFREGYTYTMKVKYYEVKVDNERDKACEGSFVFDMKVVPEYQVWTGLTGSADWTNDRNWRRADRADLHAGAEATGSGMPGATALDDATSYASNTANTTDGSFVPMYFTNVLLKANGADAVELYKGGDFNRPVPGSNFLEGLQSTATPRIVYDMAVTPVNPADRTAFNYDCNYECELFDTYVANGVTFEPSTQMGNAHYLTYNKAWVEYVLDADRWYTVASPLKKSVAGDWYSPTDGGKQLTPHFYDINYREDLNDRFRPAYFQRSWDRDGNNIVYTKTGGTYDSYVRADWSNVYNDATVNYSDGGFSVKVELDYMDPADRPTDDKVLVRLPKADTSYIYYDVAGDTGQAADAQIGARTESYRLLSDDLGANGTGSIEMNVSNETADNNFLLLSNPFIAAMDMDEFFAANTDLEAKYWIVSADRQVVSVRGAADGDWITTGDANGKYIAPLQGFFVKKRDAAPNPGSIRASYTAAMQTVVNADPVNPGVAFRAPASRGAAESLDVIRLTAERDGAESTALILLSDNADDANVAGEDCEAFIDGNLYAHPTVYTTAGAAAQTINVRKTLQMVPVGMISSDDSPATLHFDLSDSSYSILYLYDLKDDSYTAVNDGSEVTMSGNNAGRYFLTTSIEDDIDLADGDATQQGVWTVSGIYLGTTVKGLLPGVYVVDGVKIYIR